MASSTICTTCLRALRLQARKELQLQRRPQQHLRLLSTTSRNLASEQARSATNPPPLKSSSPSEAPSNFAETIASNLRASNTFRSTTEPYIAYGSTEDLFRACSAQCSYTVPNATLTPPQPAPKNSAQEDVGEGSGWWVTPKEKGGLGLECTFNTWAQVLFLHMYMLTVRLRCFPKEHSGVWHQNLLDHFFYAAEDRMAMWHGMSARGVRNKYLKDLWLQWRGLLLSYDEGLIKGDAVLATAVWRNVFRASEEVDLGDVAVVTAYLRRELKGLGEVSDEALAEGRVRFESPVGLGKVLEGKESLWMNRSFNEGDLKGVEEVKV